MGCWSHRAIDMRAYRQSLVRIKLHHWSIRWLLELWFVDKDANNLCAFMFDGSKHRKKTSKLKLIHWPTLWLIIFQVVNPLSSMKKVILKWWFLIQWLVYWNSIYTVIGYIDHVFIFCSGEVFIVKPRKLANLTRSFLCDLTVHNWHYINIWLSAGGHNACAGV